MCQSLILRFLSSFVLLFSASHAFALEDDYWGFCKDGKAYSDAALQVPRPAADWVCQAPTADQTGEAVERNSLRCLLDQSANCQVGAGGLMATHGGHNVPREAWYWIPGVTNEFPDVRCECGCFTGDVEVLTDRGPMRMDRAAADATVLGGISMGILDAESGVTKGSRRLTKRDFVVGPEEKPVVHLETTAGRSLTMTDSHPVLIARDGTWQMMRAENLQVGDVLVTGEMGEDSVRALSSYRLPEEQKLVYNFDTQGVNDYEHLIVANGLRVGDLHWQKRLAERDHRAANLLRFAPRKS